MYLQISACTEIMLIELARVQLLYAGNSSSRCRVYTKLGVPTCMIYRSLFAGTVMHFIHEQTKRACGNAYTLMSTVFKTATGKRRENVLLASANFEYRYEFRFAKWSRILEIQFQYNRFFFFYFWRIRWTFANRELTFFLWSLLRLNYTLFIGVLK